MALYIKGEKLPKYGYKELRVCPNGTLEFRDKTDVLVRIPNAVIEVKEPHGRLIDENEVRVVMSYLCCQPHGLTWNEVYYGIRNMNAVIEAEHGRNTSDD